MFTGIIEATAEVLERTNSMLILKRPAFFHDLKKGASICVSGTCLSITSFDESSMSFDIVQETWDRTMLGDLSKGGRVNLERAMKADGRFDGHIVQGHVDAVGVVMSVVHPPSPRLRGAGGHVDSVGEVVNFSRPSAEGASGETILTVTYPSELQGLIVEKGSIAISGVSLTVTEVDEEKFSVSLIPLTLSETTLGSLKEGDSVNLETDILARYAKK